MRWLIYINERLRPGKVATHTRKLYLPDTSRTDNRFATLKAAKAFNTPDEMILAIPCCTRACAKCGEHSDSCIQKWNAVYESIVSGED